MSANGLEVFDTTVQKANGWLKDIMSSLGWAERERAYLALRTTLHALRDRLTVDEVAQRGAQLPMLVRGIYYEGWNPGDTPPSAVRHREEFLARIALVFGTDDAESVASAVFGVLSHRISEGEIADVRQALPAEIRELWQPQATV